MNCKQCGKKITENVNGFCDDKCQGKYYGEKASLVDYGAAVCGVCGKEFKKKSTNQIYCTDKCRYKKRYNYKPKISKLVCKKCGKEFESTNKSIKYCSDECRDKPYNHICTRCGKEFGSIRADSKICSQECRKLTRYTKTCEYCGIEYETTNKNKRYCSSQCASNSRRKTHKEFVKELTEVHGGIIVPLNLYVSSNTSIKCKCLLCGREYNKPAHKYIGSYKEGCMCRKSKGETEIKHWLDDHGIQHREQYGFDDLKYKDKLLFDFAIIEGKEVRMLIEYDGIQHYKPRGWAKENFKEQNARDRMKDEYCKQNSIPLVRIPYTEKDVGLILSKVLA